LDTSGFQSMLLGQILVELGLLELRDIEKGLVVQSEVGGRLGSILLRAGAISETSLLSALEHQLQWPVIGKTLEEPEENNIVETVDYLGIPLAWLLNLSAVVWRGENVLYCMALDSFQPQLDEVLRRQSSEKIIYCLARTQVIESYINRLRARLIEVDQTATGLDIQALRELAEEAPVIELVNNVISMALEERASDIHIEPEEETFDIRFRIDGILYTKLTMPKQRYHAVGSRLKLISGINIAERRLPQDGRISTKVNGVDLDIRVSSLPGIHGESIVMRLLPKERQDLQLEKLGFLPDHLTLLSNWVSQPHGIVLVTGPTGSGKSTTLYSALSESNDGVRKIITVEDPVEFKLGHITQVQAHAEIGFTFAAALRSILRQDPDVIMVGEIRDLETAEIAIQSALTGHLVLSTLHTNDAISAFTRLIDMGIEPFLAATPVIALQAQRLVRRLCSCAEPHEPPNEIALRILPFVSRLYPEKEAKWGKPKGCKLCNFSGYRGRIGIYELVDINEEMRTMVLTKASLTEMQSLARQQGYRDMATDGLIKAWLGITSVEEVFRVASTHS